jgi:DNA-binding NarL/FixJ family response regulator
LDAIKTITAGKTYLSQEVSAILKTSDNEAIPITRREKEILVLIAEGLTNAEIAEKLFLSIATVNTHRKSLLEKLDAKNTAILIGKAIKNGMI